MADEVVAAMISGAAALVGAAVGGFATWWTTSVVEQRRWRREEAKAEREESRRFEKEQRLAYYKLLTVANRLNWSRARGQPILPDLEEAFTNAIAELEVLASPQSWSLAERFIVVLNDTIFNPNRTRDDVDAYYRARKSYIEAVREELGRGRRDS